MTIRDALGINAGDPTRPRPLEGIRIPEWTEQALCAQVGGEAFYPIKGAPEINTIREAKAVCGRCDVRAECLAYALANQERYGIWGGLSYSERKRLRKGRVAS